MPRFCLFHLKKCRYCCGTVRPSSVTLLSSSFCRVFTCLKSNTGSSQKAAPGPKRNRPNLEINVHPPNPKWQDFGRRLTTKLAARCRSRADCLFRLRPFRFHRLAAPLRGSARRSFRMAGSFVNPILPGGFPDPSICRSGMDNLTLELTPSCLEL